MSIAQATRDLDFYVNVLRKWVRDHEANPQQSFLGHERLKPERAQIERLKRVNSGFSPATALMASGVFGMTCWSLKAGADCQGVSTIHFVEKFSESFQLDRLCSRVVPSIDAGFVIR